MGSCTAIASSYSIGLRFVFHGIGERKPRCNLLKRGCACVWQLCTNGYLDANCFDISTCVFELYAQLHRRVSRAQSTSPITGGAACNQLFKLLGGAARGTWSSCGCSASACLYWPLCIGKFTVQVTCNRLCQLITGGC